jgi:arginase
MTNATDHLRLIWPQWQGAGSASVEAFAGEFPVDVIRRGYAVGATILEAVLPSHAGPNEVVPTEMSDRGLAEQDGVEAKEIVLEQLRSALRIIQQHGPERITTLGGDCAVSVAPFAALADRYGDELAVIWIDSHPDVDTGDTGYGGYHAMAVSAITGHGDQDIVDALPATIPASRVALVGLHSWVDDAHAHVSEWGLTAFAPDALRQESAALLDWLRSTGATKIAVHFDVDTIDAAEARLGLGEDLGGLTTAEVRRLVADLDAASQVVGFTIAEFIPREVIRMQRLLDGFPL